MGHIRDLPQPSELPTELKKTSVGKFAVDLDNDFEPYYVVYPDKKKRVSELKAKLKEADELYLATDADREGEAIAWHLLQVLKPKVPVRRLAFTEITKEGIERAWATCANWTPTWWTRRRPGACWTASTAMKFPRCSGARSPAGSPPAVFSRWPPVSWWSVNANAWRSSPPATGTSRASSPPATPNPLRPSFPPWTGPAWPPAATSMTVGSSRARAAR